MNQRIVEVRPIGKLARLADMLMRPIMYLVSGTFKEKPQETHAWHVQVLNAEQKDRLDRSGDGMMVNCEGVKAIKRNNHWWSFWFHIPIFGGWNQYVVLSVPECTGKWHIGWDTPDQTAISRLQLGSAGSVRMLLGPGRVSFFALSDHGFQIHLYEDGRGQVGDGSPNGKIRLM